LAEFNPLPEKLFISEVSFSL